jgi:hypothetical protein
MLAIVIFCFNLHVSNVHVFHWCLKKSELVGLNSFDSRTYTRRLIGRRRSEFLHLISGLTRYILDGNANGRCLATLGIYDIFIFIRND